MAISAHASVVEMQSEAKIYWEGNIDDEFCGSSVLVVMDRKTGGINRSHDASFFGDFEIEYIEDLLAISGNARQSLFDEEKFRQILKIKLPGDSKENVISVIRQLEKIDGILCAEPNYILYPAITVPNDLYYTNGNQWGLYEQTPGIMAPLAWDSTKGYHLVKIGIIDTGIAPHPDLNANLLYGRNFEIINAPTTDTHSHGTHVAGIAGAVGNNGTGIAGVCWNVYLVPLKIASGGSLSPQAFSDRVVAAIGYAADPVNAIRILNLSWGGPNPSISIRNAIRAYTGLFVAAAGNGDSNGNGKNNDTNPNYPSNYTNDLEIENMIAVGSIGSNGARSSFSNWGATTVDIFAPGGSGGNSPAGT